MIYFIQQGKRGAIKIGYTGNNIRDRIATLQTSCPYKLRLLGCIIGNEIKERRIHEHLKTYRLKGEWFKPSSFVIEYIYSTPGFTSHCNDNSPPRPGGLSFNIAEKSHIIKTLYICGWNKSHTAKALSVSRSTLYAKIKRYNIKKKHIDKVSGL